MAVEAKRGRSPEIRTDVVFNRWVIFSPARSRRPSDFKSNSTRSNPNSPANSYSSSCPFCKGNEHLCAPEIFRLPPPDISSSISDWKIRVIENLFPALLRSRDHAQPHHSASPDLPSQDQDASIATLSFPASGFHDVIIETPNHDVLLSDLSPLEIGDVLLAYGQRIRQLADDASIRYVQVFKNHGASAGASLSHSHSQIMGLPLIPPTVSARLNSMKDYFTATGKCALCKIWSGELLIDESTHFFSIVPFAASFPFEIWIVPRMHSSHFHEVNSEEAVDLGRLLKVMLMKLSRQMNDPPFNFMIHTSPLQATDPQMCYSHWFLQIVPQLTCVGGFEIGSGSNINPVFPEDAATILREMNV